VEAAAPRTTNPLPASLDQAPYISSVARIDAGCHFGQPTTGNNILGESGNLPTLTSLYTSITYIWNIQTMDSNGDFVQTSVNYQP
jgi:hypothetical protein